MSFKFKYFVYKVYESLLFRFGLGDRTFGRSIKALTETFATDYYLEEVFLLKIL